MPVNIIDNFKLGTNLPLDSRYVVNDVNDVSLYWYDGKLMYNASTNQLFIVKDTSTEQIVEILDSSSNSIVSLDQSLNDLRFYLDGSLLSIDLSINDLYVNKLDYISSTLTGTGLINDSGLGDNIAVLKDLDSSGNIQILSNGDTVFIGSNSVTPEYVDGSLLRLDSSIQNIYNNGLGFLQESSLNLNTFYFDASSLLDVSVGKYDTKKFLAGKDSTQVLTGSYSDVINWDSELVNDPVDLTLGTPYTWNSTTGILTFKESGWYYLNIGMNTDQLSGDNRANTAFRVLEDTGSGYTEIPYSETWMYNRTSGNGENSGFFSTYRQYDANDTVKVQAFEDGGDNGILSCQISAIKSEIGRSAIIYDISGGVPQKLEL
jgi:hypothetical protein